MLLELENIHKSYYQAGQAYPILRGVDLAIDSGQTLALVGPSGCGKTTLLNITGLLDIPDSGNIVLNGNEVTRSSDIVRTGLRNKFLGFVYQFHHLLPECSALENVMIPQMLAGVNVRQARTRAFELLASLGLEDRIHHRPSALSGGQMQRVAIARALANDPDIILADEPTGNLDPETAESVLSLLLQSVKEHGMALIMVTHNDAIARRMQRQVTISGGIIHPDKAAT